MRNRLLLVLTFPITFILIVIGIILFIPAIIINGIFWIITGESIMDIDDYFAMFLYLHLYIYEKIEE